MHESKGQHIGKAPSLHLFHTTADAMLLDHISLVMSWHVGEEKGLGMRLKPCHILDSITSLQLASFQGQTGLGTRLVCSLLQLTA